MKSSVKKTVAALLAAEILAAAAALWFIGRQQVKSRLYEAEIFGETVAANIELTLNQYVSIVESLGDQFLEYGEDFAPRFPGIAERILRRDDAIGSLYLAPDGIIRLAYPQEVNAATIGFEPAKDPEQGAATRLAIESKKTTVAGPHALVEGGTGFIVRHPIYTEENGEEKFAGLAILVMDWDRFVEKVTDSSGQNGLYHYAVWKDGGEGVLTDENGFIFRSGDVRERRIRIRVAAPNETWYLTVEEAGGWGALSGMLPFILGAALLLFALTVFEIGALRNRENRRRLEAKEAADQAKRQEMEERLRLQERLLAEEQLRGEQDKMITALSSDYRSVYFVDLDRDEAACYRADPRFGEAPILGARFPYLRDFTAFAENHVAEPYREGYLRFIQPENIRAQLLQKSVISYRFLEVNGEREAFAMLRMAGVRTAEQRTDNQIHAVGVGFSDIDEEMRQTLSHQEALAQALSAARDASRAKTAFLSSMSHEIRTPMNAIIGLSTLALRDETLSPAARDYMEKIDASARHLLGLINDVLDMSRIESGRMTLRQEPFSFRDMLEGINTLAAAQCEEKGLVYTCQAGDTVAQAYLGDEMKLKQALLNILSNAVKFTEPPGRVTLEVNKTAEFGEQTTLRFVISDTGIGMDEAFLPRIFDSFTQEDEGRQNKYGSTGLGMAITKNIVEMMNGAISVESEKGVGTVFTVTVTLKNAAPAEEEEPAEPAPDEKNAAEDSGEAEGTGALSGRRILLAEDVEINAEIMKQILLMRGAEADHAENGRIALEMFQKSGIGEYDAILMDVRMPEMDGLEATEAIRALPRADAKRVPIIAMTANAFDEDVQRSLQAGMNAHLTKPVEPERLFQTMEALILRRETDHARTENPEPFNSNG